MALAGTFGRVVTIGGQANDLALDEALLESAEAAAAQINPAMENEFAIDRDVLRLWEPKQLMVVVGNSSRLEDEVELNACARTGVPVLRRPSGGAAIVTGPGCLMYSLVLSYSNRPQLKSIEQAHRFVLETIAAALRPLVPCIRRAGISDLAMGDFKFSGNSLRCKRGHLMYHGTLLQKFSLHRIGELLKMPPREPEYRQRRRHGDFVANLPLDAMVLRQSLKSCFKADGILPDWPCKLTTLLAAEKYGSMDWNQRS
jgi:lipoate-protein ligase A